MCSFSIGGSFSIARRPVEAGAPLLGPGPTADRPCRGTDVARGPSSAIGGGGACAEGPARRITRPRGAARTIAGETGSNGGRRSRPSGLWARADGWVFQPRGEEAPDQSRARFQTNLATL